MSWEEKAALAVWIAHSLFDRGKTSGTTANLSFRHGDSVWISASGGCFGRMEVSDLVQADLSGRAVGPGKPSKELPLHLALYAAHPEVEAVIHTHSPYAVLWSCIPHDDPRSVFPPVTPYLRMKLGAVAEIPYAPPGSEALLQLARSGMGAERGYLLCNHGAIVGGKSLMNAFECIEELEASAFLCWSAHAAGVSLRGISE